MSVLDKIMLLLKEKGHTQSELAEYLGIDKSTVSNWRIKSKSYMKYLPNIAKFLGVSVDYLLNEKEKPTEISDRFSHDYYLLDDEDKETVDLLVASLLQKTKYKKDANVG